ncbi:hypothetical protein O6H91_14G029400 [Diphasiastrum complanatum]|uniref:Uncharacterized protein n=1 Tax=Diphasiastrum complanatum TaxID=34168 RepID=A0ACC2BMN8_DIPCM|nr:hypothetical protein O6H91_14G029400 [Diphasiastrum complanatum]
MPAPNSFTFTQQEEVNDPQQLLPIDITYSKLADWLEDRRKIPVDWRKKITSIRSRIATGLPVLPRDLDPWLLTLTPENTGYLEARRARDILIEKTPETRNLFGRLSGVVGEWDGIVHAYEKDWLYLGEGAQIMVQNVTYEIPFQKKLITRLQQQQADVDRKEAEFKRNAAVSASKYMQACQEFGIQDLQGKNIRLELLENTKVLPSLLGEIVEALCSTLVGQASQYYQAFVDYAHTEDGADSKPVLPTLAQLRAHPPKLVNNSELSDIQTAETDDHVSDVTNCATFQQEADDTIVVLDRGSTGTSDVTQSNNGYTTEFHNSDISQVGSEPLLNTLTDKERDEKSEAGGDLSQIVWDIDLDAEVMPESEENAIGDSSGIDWDIEVEENPSQHDELLQGMQEQSTSRPSGESQLSQAILGPFSFFADINYRNKILDNLFELVAFINQRIQAMESSETSALQSQVQAVAPSALQQFGFDALKEMATELVKVLNLLTNRRTRDFLMILTSSRFLDRLEDSLMQKKKNETKLLESLKDLGQKRLELRNTLSSIWPKQEAAIARTRQVKHLVEQTLFAQYDKRPVNIIGEINTILGHA